MVYASTSGSASGSVSHGSGAPVYSSGTFIFKEMFVTINCTIEVSLILSVLRVLPVDVFFILEKDAFVRILIYQVPVIYIFILISE